MHRLVSWRLGHPGSDHRTGADAVPLARALARAGSDHRGHVPHRRGAGGHRRDRRELPQVDVGAGTLLRAADVAKARCRRRAVSRQPGHDAELAGAALASDLPYLPGIATPSEVMAARALGISVMKLFPAEAMGGVAFLRALAPVFPGVAFCPTGGVDERSAGDYLALPNVPMVGGSWMAPRDAIIAGDWGRIRRLAERAAAIGRRQAA